MLRLPLACLSDAGLPELPHCPRDFPGSLPRRRHAGLADRELRYHVQYFGLSRDGRSLLDRVSLRAQSQGWRLLRVAC